MGRRRIFQLVFIVALLLALLQFGKVPSGADEKNRAISVGMAATPDGSIKLTIVGAGEDGDIDIFACTNLSGNNWVLADTVTLGSKNGSVVWVDSGSINCSQRFYEVWTHRDSDLDGIPDGREIRLYGTDPLEWDSDGDGLSDGAEIAEGGDPLDSESFPVSFSGTVLNRSRQPDAPIILEAASLDAPEITKKIELPGPGPYTIRGLKNNTSYRISAFIDHWANGIHDEYEARGEMSLESSHLSGFVSGLNIGVVDPMWLDFAGNSAALVGWHTPLDGAPHSYQYKFYTNGYLVMINTNYGNFRTTNLIVTGITPSAYCELILTAEGYSNSLAWTHPKGGIYVDRVLHPVLPSSSSNSYGTTVAAGIVEKYVPRDESWRNYYLSSASGEHLGWDTKGLSVSVGENEYSITEETGIRILGGLPAESGHAQIPVALHIDQSGLLGHTGLKKPIYFKIWDPECRLDFPKYTIIDNHSYIPLGETFPLQITVLNTPECGGVHNLNIPLHQQGNMLLFENGETSIDVNVPVNENGGGATVMAETCNYGTSAIRMSYDTAPDDSDALVSVFGVHVQVPGPHQVWDCPYCGCRIDSGAGMALVYLFPEHLPAIGEMCYTRGTGYAFTNNVGGGEHVLDTYGSDIVFVAWYMGNLFALGSGVAPTEYCSISMEAHVHEPDPSRPGGPQKDRATLISGVTTIELTVENPPEIQCVSHVTISWDDPLGQIVKLNGMSSPINLSVRKNEYISKNYTVTLEGGSVLSEDVFVKFGIIHEGGCHCSGKEIVLDSWVELKMCCFPDTNGKQGFAPYNNNDSDKDGIPDYLDGYNFDSIFGTADDLTKGEKFTLLEVHIPEGINTEECALRFDYPSSLTNITSLDGLRLWAGYPEGPRTIEFTSYPSSGNDGYFVRPSIPCPANLLARGGKIVLYVEGLAPGMSDIKATLLPLGGGGGYRDTVYVYVPTTSLGTDWTVACTPNSLSVCTYEVPLSVATPISKGTVTLGVYDGGRLQVQGGKEQIWDIAEENIPSTVEVRGILPSTAENDTILHLVYRSPDGTLLHESYGSGTVHKVDIVETNEYITGGTTGVLHLTGDSFWGDGGLSWTFSQEGETKRTYYTSSGILEYDASLLDPGKYFVKADSGYSADAATVTVVRIELVPDWNHDRKIDEHDRNRATPSNPFRFWINDDADNGDVADGDSDVPGQSGGLFGSANYKNDKVDGRCDLIDFFPVWLDISEALAMWPPGEDVQYKLKHENEALKAVYTDLTKDKAGSYLIEDEEIYGGSLDKLACSADVFKVTSKGVGLSEAFLNRIVEDAEKGVLLLEGAGATMAPVVLEIWQGSDKLLEQSLSLSISGVEEMYRWINLRGSLGGDESRATDMSEPANNPDVLSNGKQFVFVHGYSVHEKSASAWNAEMYKRLYWSGSRAMFTAVTWRGNEGQLWDWVPFVGGSTPDYYSNVKNAFVTASNLASIINNSLSGSKCIAGHSLGNMVISSAIKDHGLSVNVYFMLNAAVALEAYDASFDNRSVMRHPDWQNYTNYHLWASDWHQLFPLSDGRGKLTWRGKFNTITNGINYYSSTEDVLNNADGSLPSIGTERAWVNQEMRKGTTLMWIAPGNKEAGWGFNDHYEGMTLAEANALPDSMLQTNSFFGHFDDKELYGTNGCNIAQQPVMYRQLLADAIPALSNPAGRNSLEGSAGQGNRDFMTYNGGTGFRRGIYANGDWPINDDRWHHSDIKEVAYPYNSKAFDQIVNDGSLK